MKKKMQFNKKKGFTLIEILIVVSIIGILSSIVLVGLGPAQKQGRDARRISDLKQVQNALELYFQKCAFYPGHIPTGGIGQCGGAPVRSWAELMPELTNTLAPGVTNVPNDPNRSKTYWYGVGPEGVSYVLGAKLEGFNAALDNDVDNDVGGFIFGVDCGDQVADTIYCILF